ncbi:MAG TPA: alpha/beta hydrolase [Planctomycetota bacterium]|nr:alpha/beta hydrolase [Planctomycetota bacterium]
MNFGPAILLLALAWPQDASVREVKDLAYVTGADADDRKEKLDLFLPEKKEKFPVLMWIHGGGWAIGDRKWYAALGHRFAEQGIGCAVISYRLSPGVKHPEHIKDCARAFAWLHGHVKEYGGDPDRLFVSGQSAGGHLTALLALNRKYLEDLKVPEEAIKGIIPMSGIYQILPFKTEAPGTGLIRNAFGDDEKLCEDASPTHFVKNAKAPMLVITEADAKGGGQGVPESFFVRSSTAVFKTALEQSGFKDVTFMDAKDRNHVTIVMDLMKKGDDFVREAMVQFIRKRCQDLDR